MKKISVEVFLELKKEQLVLDVRSPAEYAHGHIPGAHSFPLFTDEERAVVGTTYKQVDPKSAIKKALEIVGPKMVYFIESAEAFGAGSLMLYCWRGGMRSESMAWLLERYGLATHVMTGGYKAYRKFGLNFFKNPLQLKVITGFTGSMKTLLLYKLREKGQQVIDIEGLANHQGSSFGNKKSTGQPSSEHFQNLILEEFLKLDRSRTIWIEDESINVGRVNMQEELYELKNNSPHVVIEAPREQRIRFLVEDYGSVPKNELIAATRAIGKKLGYDNASIAEQLISDGRLAEAVEIILPYYDSRYRKSISKKQDKITKCYAADLNDLDAVADQLIKDNGI